MEDLHTQLLHQMVRKELDLAHAAQAAGEQGKAAEHFARAGGIYRRLAAREGGPQAQELYSLASQYEQVGKAIPQMAAATGMQAVAPDVYTEAIESLIVSQKPTTRWEDIGGLADAKERIREAAILPFIKDKPAYVQAPKAILLYGPPGTGKTLLAKAAAANLQATFFEARLPALLSKYYGESTKLVSALFAKAREKAPAIVFIDELDALAQSREGEMNEATRRVLGQVLQELDGFSSGKEQVMVMGATNKPWALDDALLSRFERKILVPLPDPPAREAILKIHLRGAAAGEGLLAGLVQRTENFSGRDLANLCHEAILHMVREQNPQLDRLGPGEVERYKLAHRPLREADFLEALQKVRPGDLDLAKYAEWGKEFGE